jgi:hypothetical protein
MTDLEKNNGADLPPLRNPPKMENTDDLTSLSYLNEPAGEQEELPFWGSLRCQPYLLIPLIN